MQLLRVSLFDHDFGSWYKVAYLHIADVEAIGLITFIQNVQGVWCDYGSRQLHINNSVEADDVDDLNRELHAYKLNVDQYVQLFIITSFCWLISM